MPGRAPWCAIAATRFIPLSIHRISSLSWRQEVPPADLVPSFPRGLVIRATRLPSRSGFVLTANHPRAGVIG